MKIKFIRPHLIISLILALLLGLYLHDQAITAVNENPVIKATLYELYHPGSSVRGSHWTPDGNVEVEVYDYPAGELIVGPLTVAVDSEGRFTTPPISYFIPEMFLRVTDLDSLVIKELTLPVMEISSNDPETNIVQGLAPPLKNVRVEVNGAEVGIDTSANSSGVWEVDFTGLFDLQPGDTASAWYYDEDWDEVGVFEPLLGAGDPLLYLQGGYDWDWMEFYFFSPADMITYQVLNSEGAVLSEGETPTNAKGWGYINYNDHGIDLQAGDQIVAIDQRRIISDTITMQAITTDFVNYDTDELAGTAPPNADLIINLGVPGENQHFPLQADENGNWSINLRAEFDFDLTIDYWVYGTTFDENRNSTFAPLDEDTDQTLNGLDNAMLVFNPDQSDLDEDVVGDVADPCPSILDNTCNPDRSGAVSINQDGGTLTTLEGDTSVVVPEGSLLRDTSISITDTGVEYLWEASASMVSSPTAETWVVFSNFIGPPSLTPTIPIAITFRWIDQNNDGIVDDLGIAEKDLIIVHGTTALTGACEFEPGCDPENNQFVLSTTMLGDFSLIGAKTNFRVFLPLAVRK